MSKEARKNMSESRKKWWKENKHKLTDETRNKLRKAANKRWESNNARNEN